MFEFNFKEISPSFEENKLYRLDYLKGIRLEENRFQSDFKVASIVAVFSELHSNYQTLLDLMSLKNNKGLSIGSDIINKGKGQIEAPFDIPILPHISHGSIWNNKRKVNNVTSYMSKCDVIEITPH